MRCEQTRTSGVLTVGIGNTGGDRFRRGSGCHELDEIEKAPLLLVNVCPFVFSEPGLDGLVYHEMYHCFSHSEVRGCDSLVEASDAVLLVDLPHALRRREAPVSSATERHVQTIVVKMGFKSG